MRLKKNECVLRNVFWNSKKKRKLAIIFMKNEIKFYIWKNSDREKNGVDLR